MGYFNIFYKITRIIDMLTRKRNRKAIMVILIIIAVVFIFHNKVNAQEDTLVYNQSFTHSHIRLNSDGSVQYGTINTTSMYYSIVFPVKEGFTYKGSCTSAPSDAPLKVGFVSELDNMIYTYTAIENATYVNYGPGAVPIIGVYNSTSGFEITAPSDGYFIIGGFRPGSSAIDYNDCGFQVYTDYNGESNLNTINQDLLRIENLLRDYLYGDSQEYSVSTKNIKGLWFTISDTSFQVDNTGNTQVTLKYFKVKKHYTYNVKWNYLSSLSGWTTLPRFCYSSDIPSLNLPISEVVQFNNNGGSLTSGTYTYTAQNDGYLSILYRNDIFSNLSINSNYNEGQEIGLYGGLTNIQDETTYQGEQTRDTITSTEYNQSDVNVNTSAIDSVSSTEVQGLFTTIFNNFNSAITGGTDSIIVPLPHGRSISFV